MRRLIIYENSFQVGRFRQDHNGPPPTQLMNQPFPMVGQFHMPPPTFGMPHLHTHQQQHPPQVYSSQSRGQTPTTTHSDSKRSSPQNAEAQQQNVDYTPPGTPQNLTPLTDGQKQNYIEMAPPFETTAMVEKLASELSEINMSKDGGSGTKANEQNVS
jgi:hypothetical protein